MEWSRFLLVGSMLIAAGAQGQESAKPVQGNHGAQNNQGKSVAYPLRAAIDAANTQAVEAYNRGDVTSFVQVYADDAWVMPANMPAQKGRPAITEYWQGGWKMGVRNVKLKTLELRGRGDMAYEVGSYELDVQPQEGASPGAVTAHDRGKYIVIWKRSATGQWQWYRDCFNTDVATPK
ncbi:MAG: hypothetical protein NVS1B4_01270 [Gemmatimonadaceae bacterium]